MDQIGIKLPKSEIKFLEWYSAKYAESKAGAYRNATLDAFQKWKLSILLEEYSKGKIGFKEMCDLASITLLEGMNIVELEDIEPPITEAMDNYSMELAQRNIKDGSVSFTKSKKPLKRNAPPIELK